MDTQELREHLKLIGVDPRRLTQQNNKDRQCGEAYADFLRKSKAVIEAQNPSRAHFSVEKLGRLFKITMRKGKINNGNIKKDSYLEKTEEWAIKDILAKKLKYENYRGSCLFAKATLISLVRMGFQCYKEVVSATFEEDDTVMMASLGDWTVFDIVQVHRVNWTCFTAFNLWRVSVLVSLLTALATVNVALLEQHAHKFFMTLRTRAASQKFTAMKKGKNKEAYDYVISAWGCRLDDRI
uniref:Uncharacterized protein n=1 Tax=Chromera velia CCMP2878 TaxID=1169474 RepID=A0A0G4GVV7_9ALVE|eukprot:Cvel_5285.t1-p1 / transcript=Cvel_5285.t1 / gene=Cvel_5285 / organism=Chromera_velia_CCMP2878 / gene_product=hypothetical protein / transcript_product=hypothetical protein / location=Cvel_scaffold244:52334-53647(+) / protein_length=238 / sequence_SO=supercontig / SO=protein_coding / is_pseudo=false